MLQHIKFHKILLSDYTNTYCPKQKYPKPIPITRATIWRISADTFSGQNAFLYNIANAKAVNWHIKKFTYRKRNI